MKIRSLLLGSVAAAGLATGAHAADLGVMTSLDVCDALGLSGLTISSDSNCLQITGTVDYRFRWGDYSSTQGIVSPPDTGFSAPTNMSAGLPFNEIGGNGVIDWESRVQTTLGLVATADSGFGPASAHVTFYYENDIRYRNAVLSLGANDTTATAGGIIFKEAYVSVGDSTVIVAGRRGFAGSVFNGGDDDPYNYLGTFQSEWNASGAPTYNPNNNPNPNSQFGSGVWFNDLGSATDMRFSGDVVQVTTDLGNGLSAAAGLENITDTAFYANTGPLPPLGSGVPSVARAGTLVGTLAYKGDNLTAHISAAAGGVLDGIVEWAGIHAGATLTMDNYNLRAAIAANNSGFVQGILTGKATFDMFTIALTGDFSAGGGSRTQVGVGGSVGVKATDAVSLNAGFRFFDPDTTVAGNEVVQGGIQAILAVTETLTLTGEAGLEANGAAAATGGAPAPQTIPVAPTVIPYAAAYITWAPGGGFTTTLRGDVVGTNNPANGSNPGFRIQYQATKTFQ